MSASEAFGASRRRESMERAAASPPSTTRQLSPLRRKMVREHLLRPDDGPQTRERGEPVEESVEERFSHHLQDYSVRCNALWWAPLHCMV